MTDRAKRNSVADHMGGTEYYQFLEGNFFPLCVDLCCVLLLCLLFLYVFFVLC